MIKRRNYIEVSCKWHEKTKKQTENIMQDIIENIKMRRNEQHQQQLKIATIKRPTHR